MTRKLKEMRKIVDSAKKNGISAIIASDQSVIQYAVLSRYAGPHEHTDQYFQSFSD